jgi:hypothetical protein
VEISGDGRGAEYLFFVGTTTRFLGHLRQKWCRTPIIRHESLELGGMNGIEWDCVFLSCF